MNQETSHTTTCELLTKAILDEVEAYRDIKIEIAKLQRALIQEKFENKFKCIATKADMKMYHFARHFGIGKWTPNYSERRQF